MIWKVTSSDGKRWVGWNGTDWDADPASRPGVAAYSGQPVEVATMSVTYTPREDPDELGTFLLARYLLGADATVTGSPPQVPEPPEIDPAVVY